MLSFLRKDPRRAPIERLHADVAAASRAPALYAGIGLPDTLEGRFESLGLHLVLVLRRLRALPAPAGDVGQDLVDCFFRHLDGNLREMGVGDTVVPKRMKKLAGAFYDLTRRYDPLIDAPRGGELAAALAEGFSIGLEPAGVLADYVLAAERELARADLDTLLGGGVRWPRADVMAGDVR